jgi:hypothetical protein
VLQEFYVAVTRKLEKPLPPKEAKKATRGLSDCTVVNVDVPLIFRAIEWSQRDSLSF